jgi:DNA segregation ATPase FtsK/SpoIIIE, S-DNA-T family
VIGRAIWRYRSELAPIIIAALTATTAAILHRAHPEAWPWLAVATAGGIALLAAPLPAWTRKAWDVLDRPAERIYVAAVTAATGGWLTAATMVGPAIAPMPAVAVALTVGAASHGGPAADAAPRSALTGCSNPGQRSRKRSD